MILFGRKLPAMSSLLIWAVLWEIIDRRGVAATGAASVD